MEHITMYKGTDYHSAFPEVIRLQNGDLLTVFRQAPVRPPNEHEGLRNAVHVHHHQDPGSRTVLVRSTDDGETWDIASHTIVDSGGDQDLNLAMIAQVSSGQIIVNNMRLFSGWTDEQAAEVENEKWVLPKRPGRNFGRMVWDSLYLYRSDDNGHTFAPAEPFSVDSMTYWSHTGKTGIVELPDGTWLLPFHGMGSPEEIGRVYVVRSYDQGKSWVRPSTVAYDPNGQTSFGEPPLLRLANGRLLTMMRTGGGDDHMYQAYSTDDGWTWRGLKKSPTWGYPCNLIELDSGRILCTYGYRREPFGIRAAFSDDQGETWDMDNEVVIRDDGLHVDLGYPSSIQKNDGRILSTYYYHGEDGIRFIGGSVWSESDVYG